MSVRAVTWVWQQSRADGNVGLVRLAIADSSNDAGLEAWPAMYRLCQKTRLSERTVPALHPRAGAAGGAALPGGPRSDRGRRVSNRNEVIMASSGQIDRSMRPTTGQAQPTRPANLAGRIEEEPSKDHLSPPRGPPTGGRRAGGRGEGSGSLRSSRRGRGRRGRLDMTLNIW
jgi:hypothetical protein